VGLHQGLEALGERRLAAADRAEQVEDLLALLQSLGGVSEIADQPLDGVLHAVEVVERRVDLDGAVHEDAAEPGVLGGVDDLGLADRRNHPLGGRRACHRVGSAELQVLHQTQFRLLAGLIGLGVLGKDVLHDAHTSLHGGHHATAVRGLVKSSLNRRDVGGRAETPPGPHHRVF
jgi:hypothetical protein